MRSSVDAVLQVGGGVYGGWKAIQVATAMDRAAGQFGLQVTELWPGADRTRQIRPGDACELRLDEQVLVSGWVDVVDLGIDAGRHEVAIAGRDKAADLVDCSAVRSPGQWRNRSVLDIAKDLAGPFGVAVAADVDVGKPLASFALQEGESVFEAIERAARTRGLLVAADGVGGVVLTRAGVLRADEDLVFGHNILAAQARFDARDRYSVYLAKGQAPGSDYFNGTAAAHVQARAEDAQVTRYRPLLITGEAPDMAGSLRDRVQWEATVRAAKSMQVTITVAGWTQRSGQLWRPNRLVHVDASPLRLDQDLLIVAVNYELAQETGSRTTLTLTRPDAFTLAPVAAPKAAAAAAGGQFWDVAGARR
ncbi:MAG: hypothetical protein J0M20_01340 [Burkholderiales bacterium]|nr:hypothetical protein [Burkholderiales bacterium]